MTFKELDAQLIAPKRFVTLAYLHQVEQADYPALQEATGLSTPDLSKIIGGLEQRGLVAVAKERRARYSATLVRLTAEGRATFTELLATLNRIAGQ